MVKPLINGDLFMLKNKLGSFSANCLSDMLSKVIVFISFEERIELSNVLLPTCLAPVSNTMGKYVE